MKAAIIRDYNTEIEIADIAAPELHDDSVLVAVHAASVNPIDYILQSGAMKDNIPLEFPHVMGFDVSGEIIALGKDVSGFKVGDAVFARANQQDAGAIAQIARVKADELALKPVNISHAEAASVPLAGLTAWQALISKGRLKKGDKVLIHAGSGGVGTLAIQIAKHFGADVATTCSPRNADLVRKLGADTVINYRDQSFEDELSDYDIVLDMMGGEILNRSFQVLKKGGALISIKGQDTDNLAQEHDVRFEWFFMEPDGAMLADLGKLVEDGIVKPVIDKTYPMEATVDAYAYLKDGHAVGKVVISIPPIEHW
ncbi:NADP-dependent oxidoreductase [Roseobacter litoralis]|uniref:Zinc-binding alcohol dehydrogenase, GroES like protein n=1 Tax=Roseobacter litoralis (strain ATCC 49566 / DSM 6996 / JCM 21268 / NBRC 15278 / OCh 149) TaxID=391595 RepID=F7ZES8_ROSLO|nr:NADP-dependent oxidoreductase [Roseobacter litoralis]AEI92159.1 putative zinc-binding alcohol dehydrogenase, GroES like protein [Roseobacter litoralis Och 149]